MFIYNDPLEQFEIIPLVWATLSCPSAISNFTVILVLNLLIIQFLMYFVSFLKTNVVTIWNLSFLNLYSIAKSIIKTNTLLVRYEYFAILFYLFLFVFISNLIGLTPYSFTLTSSFVLTFFLAFMNFLAITLLGIFHKKWKFSSMFLPEGVPLMLAPILIPIEIVSYVSRVFSLSIRLFANMMSGHALLKILIGFSWTLLCTGSLYSLLSLFPWLIVTVILFLELLIAFLQAYVFVILTAIYINDVISSH